MEEMTMKKAKKTPKTCIRCKASAVEVRVENYRYDASGLPNVTLQGIEVRHCAECGEREALIPAVSSLHRVLAMALATKQERLTPQEIKFLRKYLGFSSGDFASKLGVDKSTVSRYESVDEPQTMARPVERLLRLMVMVEKPVEKYPLEETATKDPAPTARMTVAVEAGNWSVATA
jgi:putative zinc finger/helix-turn-helix YgiT family protein